MEELQKRPWRFATARRAVTDPIIRQKAKPPQPPEAVETLYVHHDAKIVSFSVSGSVQSSEKLIDKSTASTSLLPWSSSLERTIGVGQFHIYRAPGSVAFISCGPALQPILPKSQCWCVDRSNHIFVLQIRKPFYWRIELFPPQCMENSSSVEMLVQTLDRVLLFEKTLCPFRRPFSIELPEPPVITKKPWSARSRDDTSSMVFGMAGATQSIREAESSMGECHAVEDPSRRQSSNVVTGPTLHLEITQQSRVSSVAGEVWSPGASAVKTHNENSPIADDRVANEATGGEKEVAEPNKSDGLLEGSGSEDNMRHPRLRYFLGTYTRRSVTSPAHLVTGNPSHCTGTATGSLMQSPAAEEFASWNESAHGTALSLAPGACSASLPTSRALSGRRRRPNTSSQVRRIPTALGSVSSATREGCDSGQVKPDAPPDIHDDGSLKTPSEDDGSGPEKPTCTSNVSLGPVDSVLQPETRDNPIKDGSSTLAGRYDDLEGDFDSCPASPAIVTRTNDILLGPPSHLIAIMLRIAARICDGEWKGRDECKGESGKVMPVRWDYSTETTREVQ